MSEPDLQQQEENLDAVPVIPEEPDVEQDDMFRPEEQDRLILSQKISTNLSNICKTFDGTAYSFGNLICTGQQINKMYGVLQNYQTLRKIDLSNNLISAFLDGQYLPQLTDLNLAKNDIRELSFASIPNILKHLRVINLQDNKITELPHLEVPSLEELNLNNNQIVSASQFKGHQQLKKLELRKNKLKNLDNIGNMRSLIELYVAENEIDSINGLFNVPQLKRLHARKNKIIEFSEPPTLPSLNHLNVRENQIPKVASFNGLVKYQDSLKYLTAHGNPVQEEIGDAFKKEIIMILSFLTKISKDEVTEEERTDALNEKKERELAEIERKRQEQEELDRLEAERKELEELTKKQQEEAYNDKVEEEDQ